MTGLSLKCPSEFLATCESGIEIAV